MIILVPVRVFEGLAVSGSVSEIAHVQDVEILIKKQHKLCCLLGFGSSSKLYGFANTLAQYLWIQVVIMLYHTWAILGFVVGGFLK